MKTKIHLLSYSANFFLKREMFRTKVVEKIKTHILCSIWFFFFFAFGNRVVHEKKW